MGPMLPAESWMPDAEPRASETRFRSLQGGAAKVCLSSSGTRFYYPTWFLPDLGSHLIFVPCGCQLPQTEWLKTTDIHSVIAGETRSPKMKVSAGYPPSRGSKEKNPFLLLLASGGSRYCLALENSVISASVFTWPFLCVSSSVSYKDSCHWM